VSVAHVCLSLCLSVLLFARTSQKLHVLTSRNFLYMSPVAVARSSSDASAICCVLPVLWMTSCFHTMAPMAHNQRRRYVSSICRVAAPGAKFDVNNCLVDFYGSFARCKFAKYCRKSLCGRILCANHVERLRIARICYGLVYVRPRTVVCMPVL